MIYRCRKGGLTCGGYKSQPHVSTISIIQCTPASTQTSHVEANTIQEANEQKDVKSRCLKVKQPSGMCAIAVTPYHSADEHNAMSFWMLRLSHYINFQYGNDRSGHELTTRDLPQLAWNFKPLRHAVIAISLAASVSDEQWSEASDVPKILVHYGKAIACVNDKKTPPVVVSLIAWLFWQLFSLHDNWEAASLHLYHAYRIAKCNFSLASKADSQTLHRMINFMENMTSISDMDGELVSQFSTKDELSKRVAWRDIAYENLRAAYLRASAMLQESHKHPQPVIQNASRLLAANVVEFEDDILDKHVTGIVSGKGSDIVQDHSVGKVIRADIDRMGSMSNYLFAAVDEDARDKSQDGDVLRTIINIHTSFMRAIIKFALATPDSEYIETKKCLQNLVGAEALRRIQITGVACWWGDIPISKRRVCFPTSLLRRKYDICVTHWTELGLRPGIEMLPPRMDSYGADELMLMHDD